MNLSNALRMIHRVTPAGSMTCAEARHESGHIEALELDPTTDRYPDLRRVLAYWERKRAGRFAPSRADIDPADLIEVLPRVMLVDVIQGPLDFRYRLSGTAIREVHGQEPTGLRPRDLNPPAYGALIHEHYCLAVRRREPLLHIIVLDTRERSRSYARLLMPLSEDGRTVTMLMTVDSKEQNTTALKNFFRDEHVLRLSAPNIDMAARAQSQLTDRRLAPQRRHWAIG